jgi:hypothetical protein
MTIASAGISVADPNVTGIALIAGGLRHGLRFSSVQLPIAIRTRIYNPINCAYTENTLSASVTLDMVVTADTLSSVSNGTVQMQSGAPSVTISNLSLTATGNTTIDSLLSSLLNQFHGVISDAIEDQLSSFLPELEEAFLNPLLAQTFSFSGQGYGFDVNVISGIDGQSINATALTQTGYAQVFPSSAAPPGVDRGSLFRPIGPAGFDSATEPLTYAINDNLINNGLWALWYGASFELEDVLGLPGVRMGIRPWLPPVIMPGSTEDQSVLGLGDLQVALMLTLAEGTVPGVAGEVAVDAFVSQYLTGALRYSAATRQLQLMGDPAESESFVQVVFVSLDGEPVRHPDQANAIRDYAETLISSATAMLMNDSLAVVALPPLTLDFTQALGGGTVTRIELSLQQVRDRPHGIFIDLRVEAESTALPGDAAWLSMNHPWTNDDLSEQGVPFLDGSVDYPQTDAEEGRSYQTTVGEYRERLDACNAAGTNAEGDECCLASWQEPLDYAWYCGGGRPVGCEQEGQSWLDNPMLDPVDFCCRLHDRNLFDPELAALSPLHACGFAMCLHEARASTADIFASMPNVERARANMYNRAAILCAGVLLAPVGDPEVGPGPL